MAEVPASTDPNEAAAAALTPDGGVKKTVVQAGPGPMPPKDALLQIHYVALSEDGVQHESTYDEGGPILVTKDSTNIPQGIHIAIGTMTTGERALLRCTGPYAYGSAGNPPLVPPDCLMIFVVDLVSWQLPQSFTDLQAEPEKSHPEVPEEETLTPNGVPETSMTTEANTNMVTKEPEVEQHCPNQTTTEGQREDFACDSDEDEVAAGDTKQKEEDISHQNGDISEPPESPLSPDSTPLMQTNPSEAEGAQASNGASQSPKIQLNVIIAAEDNSLAVPRTTSSEVPEASSSEVVSQKSPKSKKIKKKPKGKGKKGELGRTASKSSLTSSPKVPPDSIEQ
uniref:peptidylprolyl isomerase n=1 Tax=Eutreptiella gymnastica TaxID=73025 RepID=A0A6U8J422_9EUGL